MNRKDLQELRVQCGYPAITVIMSCDKKRVTDTVKKLLDEIREVVFPPDAIQRISQMLESLTCPIIPLKIAIFIDKHRARFFWVPAQVEDVAACDTSFKLDGIGLVLNHTLRYWVVDCTAHKGGSPLLIEGMEDQLLDLQDSCVLFDTKNCASKDSCFFACFNTYLEQDPLPTVFIGCAEQQELAKIFSPYQGWLVGHIENREEAIPTINRWYNTEIEKILKKIEQPGESDFIIDIKEIISSARQGFVTLLAVEKGYMRAGCEHHVTRAVLLNTQCPLGYHPISAIDELIEEVRSKGGSILFVPDGSLIKYNRMVAFISTQG
ncbi:MAG: hypothetical protein UW09_C0004G0001 [candidate division TM6 bacterium GW2011_GWF2_43_87]|nr:MAG: hypothetical protein UW09_C0004G0001 [candidate division TM6 bacterium GW2011_GWF2_43_87]